MPKVILFDIDNTLLYTGGAGGFAMNIAFNEMFGVPDGFARVEFSGRTDRWILDTALTEHGIEGGAAKYLEPFSNRYYELLPATVAERDGYLMPGFPALLEVLRQRSAILGLATGNLSRGADIKLAHYGISDYFQGGGFGEVSNERSDVVADAIRNVASGAPPADILVIGDTPHDITAALDNSAVGVGVATGRYTTEELKDSGAQLIFTDFSDVDDAVERLLAV